jgi:hypothetical protein
MRPALTRGEEVAPAEKLSDGGRQIEDVRVSQVAQAEPGTCVRRNDFSSV